MGGVVGTRVGAVVGTRVGEEGRELSEGPKSKDLMIDSVDSRNCTCGSRVVMAATTKTSLRVNWTM